VTPGEPPFLERFSLRARLTAALVAVLGSVLLAYAIGAYLVIHDRFATELDHRLDQELEIVERSISRDADGRLVWRQVHAPEPGRGERPRNVSWVDVWSADGQLIHRSQDAASEAGTTPILSLGETAAGFQSLELPGDVHLRLLQRQVVLEGQPLILRAALREDDFARGLRVVLWVMAGALPVALLLAGASGYWLAGRGLMPIQRMAGEAERIHAERLDARLPVVNRFDETGRLAVAFNALLGRLEAAFEQLRQFTADASHELRTPLTVIRSVGEMGLRETHSVAEYRDIIGTMLEEVDRLTLLTTMLLDLTRSEGRRPTMDCVSIDLCELAADAAGFLGVLAEEARVDVRLDLPAESIRTFGDWTALRQAFINLLDNAIKHSPPESVVVVSGFESGSYVELSVKDSGPGIPKNELPFIFDRFYRLDRSRSQPRDKRGGFGLGLSIARRAVEAHGGRISVESAPGEGSLFRVTLPRAGTEKASADESGS